MIKNALGFFVCFLLPVQLSLAAPILTQTPAINVVTLSDFDSTTIIADDFALTSGDFVRTVSWRGTYIFGTTIPSQRGQLHIVFLWKLMRATTPLIR